jgi:hypothetical protein
MANTYVDGRVHVRRRQCKSCIFGPNPAVAAERRDGMVAECAVDDGVIPCHAHLHEGEAIEPVCRGFYDLHQNTLLELAEVVGVVTWIEEPR